MRWPEGKNRKWFVSYGGKSGIFPTLLEAISAAVRTALRGKGDGDAI